MNTMTADAVANETEKVRGWLVMQCGKKDLKD